MPCRGTVQCNSLPIVILVSESAYTVKVDLEANFSLASNLTASSRGEVRDEVNLDDFVNVCKCNATWHCDDSPLKQEDLLRVCTIPLNKTRVEIDTVRDLALEFNEDTTLDIIKNNNVENAQISGLIYDESGKVVVLTYIPVRYFNHSGMIARGTVRLEFPANKTRRLATSGDECAAADEGACAEDAACAWDGRACVPAGGGRGAAASFELAVALADGGPSPPDELGMRSAAVVGAAGVASVLGAAACVAWAVLW